ncbi:glycine cleavage system protein R [Candidatus Entotheonella palauensis]|uniref:glycine cleavage system protein R n=1 Tax=Candidatus Entotheonella palauensis TaxID=93172 RepID=UPI000B7E5371|nr:ACT domain-containing protein [Candidatus Entotheonella palauensis]
MAAYLVLTVLGEDRPGLVEAVSQAIAAHGGNWLESRMSRLAGKFAGILRASVPDTQIEALTAALSDLEPQGLRMLIEWSDSDEPAQAYQVFRLNLMGNDRVGIIRDISQALAAFSVNIDELNTDYVSAPMSGESLFKATALIRVPHDVAFVDLQANLDHLAHELMVEIDLEGTATPNGPRHVDHQR